MLREGVHYTCIACISIDSVKKMEKKKIPTSLFRRMQVKGREKKDAWIYRHWLRAIF